MATFDEIGRQACKVATEPRAFDLARLGINWQRAPEGWQMRESHYIKEFEDRGEQQGVLSARLAGILER